MDRLDSLALFLRIVEKGGLAVAGRDVGLSPAAVSERLAALEAHYGARLLNRTTRAISLTDEGRLLMAGARHLVNDAGDLESLIRLGVEKLSGPIRIGATLDLGRNRVARLLDRFIAEHPEISVDLMLTDGYVDLVAQGLDLAVRFGDLKDSSLHSRKLGANRRVTCAAPSYLERHGTPAHPEELSGHNCLLMRFGATVHREWPFEVAGKHRVFAVTGNRIANDGALVREWCLDGHGVALKSIWDVGEDLQSGRLVELLAGFTTPQSFVQILYPGGRAVPRRVRALIDFLADGFADGVVGTAN